MELFKILGKIAVENGEANKNLDNTSSKASDLGSKLKSGLATAAKVSAAAIAAVGTAAGVAGAKIWSLANETAAYGDTIDKNSQKMGMTAEAYQEWDFVMQHCGTSITSMQASMKTLATAAETDNKAFKALGITQKQIASMSQEELFAETIKGLQNCTDETERTYLAGQLLGRGATELGALLNMSAEDTEALIQQCHDLGIVMSDDNVKASAAFQDALQNARQSVSGMKYGLVSELLPGFTTFLDGFSESVAGVDGGIEKMGEGMSQLFSNLGTTFTSAKDTISRVISQIKAAFFEAFPGIEAKIENAKDVFWALGEACKNNLQPIIDDLSAAWDTISEALQPAIDKGQDFFDRTVEWITNGEALNDIFFAITDATKWLAEAYETAKTAVEGIVAWCTEHQTLLETIVIIIGSFAAAFGLVNAAIVVWNGICAVASVVTTAFGTAMAILTSPITLVVLAIGALIAIIVLCVKHWDEIKAVAQQVWASIVTWVQNAVANVGAAIDNMVAWLASAWESIKETATAVWNGIWTAIKGVINSILGGVESMVNGVITGINKILSGISSVASAVGSVLGLDWSVGTLPGVSLPRLAKGGVLEKGQVGLLEGSGAEAVVPLENNRKWISAVAADMDAAFGGGEAVVILREMLEEISSLKDAIASMRFEINHREFGRLVKAVN